MRTKILLLLLIHSFFTQAQNISTVAGNGTASSTGDGGAATAATINGIDGICVGPGGVLYLAEELSHRIRKLTVSTGIITLVAGTGTLGYSGDAGAATAAQLNGPSGAAVDGSGNFYFADHDNSRVRKITPAGIISTVAGGVGGGYSGDGGPAISAGFEYPNDVALDAAGNLYIADDIGYRIRKVTAATGIITTVAGTGTAGYSGNGGPATAAKIDYPKFLELDAAGNLYFCDKNNHVIRKVTTATGIITTVAGTGTAGFSGDGGLATAAMLNGPRDIVFDYASNLYFADRLNNRIRKIDAVTGIITTIAGSSLTGSYGGDGGLATAAQLNGPTNLTITAAGIYISDYGNYRIRLIAMTGLTLPIELLSFDAKSNNSGDIDINFETASELNNDYFSIERSADAQNFETILKIDGAGTVTSKRSYKATDFDPLDGTSYYRLKQTDYDGKHSYSKIIAVESDQMLLKSDFTLFPNPGNGENLSISLNSNWSKEVLVVVQDIFGKESYSNLLITSVDGNNVFSMDLSNKLSPGVYMVIATSRNGIINKKLIVK